MKSDAVKERWDVWTAFVRYRNDAHGKVRPVIVIDDLIVLCLCMPTTTTKKDERYGIEIENWQYANLDEPSWVLMEYTEVKPNKFVKRIGTLHEDDIRAIKERLRGE